MYPSGCLFICLSIICLPVTPRGWDGSGGMISSDWTLQNVPPLALQSPARVFLLKCSLEPTGEPWSFLWNSSPIPPSRCARTFAHLKACSRCLRIHTISLSASLKHALSIRPWRRSPGTVIKTVLRWIKPMQFSRSYHLGISPATAEHLASNFWARSFVFL